MKQQTPTSAETLTGVVITTAEAEVTCKSIIGLLAVDLKEIHSDLPQLRNRVQESRKARGRFTAVPLPSVR
jgi:hypothetical protein